MENNQDDQLLNYGNSLYDNLENLSKHDIGGMHNMENYIEELHNNFQQETLNIYTYYTNIREVIDNLVQEFPMIDISNFTDFITICEELFKFMKNSEKIFNISSELENENKLLRENVDNLTHQKIILKSQTDNDQKELCYKEYQIKKLEDDLSCLTKDYAELDTKFNKLKNSQSDEEEINENSNKNEKSQNSNRRISYLLTNQQTEMINLIETKNKLIKDNEIFERKIIHLENEIKTKYYLKSEFEIKVQMYETEKNLSINKIKNIENKCEKIQKDNMQLNTNKDNLLIELELLQKKYNDLLDKSNNNLNLDLSPTTNNKENIGNLQNILNEENFYENENFKDYDYEDNSRIDLKRRIDKINIGLSSQFEGIGLLLEEKNNINNTKISTKQDRKYSNVNNININIDETSFSNKKDIYTNKINHKINNNEEEYDDIKVYSAFSLKDILNEKQKIDVLSSRNSIENNKSIRSIINNQNLFGNQNQYEIKERENNFNNERISISLGKNIRVRNSLKKTNEIINNNSDPMNKTKNKNELSILSIDKRSSIRNKKFNQSQNINLNVNSNLNQSHQEDSIIKKSPLIINSLEYYRNYFNLLFSSFKLNSKKQEIFENIKQDILFQKITSKNIPFNKYYHFLKKEIKDIESEYIDKEKYNQNKFNYVMNYLASKLY